METNIYLVRHAHSIYTPDELNRPLSNKGHQDSKKVTNKLIHEAINVVISSPYKRAIQTVEGIALYFNNEIIIMDEFKGRKLSYKPVDDFNSTLKQLWKDYSFNLDGGESNNQAQKRGINGLSKVLKRYKGKNIVIGTHGNIMTLIMNHYQKTYDYHFWKQLEMPDIYKLSFLNETIKKIEKL